MPTTDYHVLCRDAVKTALDGLELGVPVVTLDDVEVPTLPSLPCIAVACVGPEQDRPDFGTNQQDGIGYPVAVALLSAGVAGGAKIPGTNDMTLFRRRVRNAFHNKRLAGVDQVGYCEVSPDGPVVDQERPYFQKLSTHLTVVCVGRFPRA